MSQERRIAVVTAADGYAGILQALRDRQAELGLALDTIDAIVMGRDSENRYASKWLSGQKALGPKSWGDALGGLALKIAFIEDEDALRKIKQHVGTRDDKQIRPAHRIRVTTWLFTPRSGRKAGKRRLDTMTPEQRSKAARRAANVRWQRVRAARRGALPRRRQSTS